MDLSPASQEELPGSSGMLEDASKSVSGIEAKKKGSASVSEGEVEDDSAAAVAVARTRKARGKRSMSVAFVVLG